MEPFVHRVHPLDRRALVLITTLCLCWGLYQVSVKVASIDIPPVLQAGLRSLGGALLVLLWCRLRGKDLFGSDGTLTLGLLAGAMFALEFGLIYVGITMTDVAHAVLLFYTMPFMVAVGAHFVVPGDRMSWFKVTGLVAAFGGLILVFAGRNSGTAQLIGDVLCLGAAAVWAATTLMIKMTRLGQVSPEKILFYQLAVSAVLLTGTSLVMGEPAPRFDAPLPVLSMIFQIVVVSFASYIAWFWLITQYAPSKLAAFTFVTPVAGVVFGALLLDEPIGLRIVGALLLIGGGIWLVNRDRS